MKIKIKSWKNGKIERQFQNSPQVILKYDCPGYSVQQILLQSLSDSFDQLEIDCLL